MAVSLTTEDKLEYNFHPVQGGQIQFRIRAPNDAHVALTTAPFEGDPMLEIFIGGWKNTKSVIRKNRTKPDVAEVETPDILSNDELRGFWIRWNGGVITVGKENEPEPFMTFEDPEPFEISNFGICTGWGACGEWLIEERCIYGDGGAPAEECSDNPTPSAPSGDQLGTSWCTASSGVVPPDAVVAGDDGEPLYVGRAEHEGATLPGKVKPGHGVCYISWGGQEIPKTEYQVLCGCNGIWVPATGDNIPPNAVPGGQTEEGEPLFIGRVNHESSLTPGKVHPSHNCLYIPYGGEEISYQEFEILTS